MDEHDADDWEIDPRFPSGAWTGFFLQYWLPGRHTTGMRLTWRNGELAGTGRDWAGSYTVSGSYDLATGRCTWTKRYLGRHAIEYRGMNDGRGIWGVWEMPQLFGLFMDRGGFHIWPEGLDVSEEADQTEQAVLAAIREEFGGRFPLMTARIIGILILVASIAAILLRHWLLG